MKTFLLFLVSALVTIASLSSAEIPPEKRKEIEKMLRLTGMEKLMDQMKAQMLSAYRAEFKEVPEAFWARFEQKMDMRELLEKIIPLYDKYYTLEDLKAVNTFYESKAGQKVLSILPQIMQESTAIGMDWGKKIGELAAKEADLELKKAQKE